MMEQGRTFCVPDTTSRNSSDSFPKILLDSEPVQISMLMAEISRSITAIPILGVCPACDRSYDLQLGFQS